MAGILDRLKNLLGFSKPKEEEEKEKLAPSSFSGLTSQFKPSDNKSKVPGLSSSVDLSKYKMGTSKPVTIKPTESYSRTGPGFTPIPKEEEKKEEKKEKLSESAKERIRRMYMTRDIPAAIKAVTPELQDAITPSEYKKLPAILKTFTPTPKPISRSSKDIREYYMNEKSRKGLADNIKETVDFSANNDFRVFESLHDFIKEPTAGGDTRTREEKMDEMRANIKKYEGPAGFKQAAKEAGESKEYLPFVGDLSVGFDIADVIQSTIALKKSYDNEEEPDEYDLLKVQEYIAHQEQEKEAMYQVTHIVAQLPAFFGSLGVGKLATKGAAKALQESAEKGVKFFLSKAGKEFITNGIGRYEIKNATKELVGEGVEKAVKDRVARELGEEAVEVGLKKEVKEKITKSTINKSVKEVTENIAKPIAKRGILNRAQQRAFHIGMKVTNGLITTTLMTPISQIFRIPADTAEKYLNDVIQTDRDPETGEIVKGPNNEIKFMIEDPDTDIIKHFTKAAFENWVEVVSEYSGGAFKEVLGPLSNVAKNRLIKMGVIKAFAESTGKGWWQKLVSATRSVGFNGVLEEMGEERIADAMNGILYTMKLSDQKYEGMPSMEQLGIEGLAFLIPGAAMKSLRLVDKAQQWKRSQNMKKEADKVYKEMRSPETRSAINTRLGELKSKQESEVLSDEETNELVLLEGISQEISGEEEKFREEVPAEKTTFGSIEDVRDKISELEKKEVENTVLSEQETVELEKLRKMDSQFTSQVEGKKEDAPLEETTEEEFVMDVEAPQELLVEVPTKELDDIALSGDKETIKAALQPLIGDKVSPEEIDTLAQGLTRIPTNYGVQSKVNDVLIYKNRESIDKKQFDTTPIAEKYITNYTKLSNKLGSLVERAKGKPDLQEDIIDLFNDAYNDRLTGMPGPNYYSKFYDTLSKQYQAAGDIDNFGYFNNIWSHEIGDRVLKAIGGIAREMDLDIARKSGEELAVFVGPNVTPTEFAEKLMALNTRLNNSFVEDDNGNVIRIPTLTWGIGHNLDYADHAMRAQKFLNKGDVNFHLAIDNPEQLIYNGRVEIKEPKEEIKKIKEKGEPDAERKQEAKVPPRGDRRVAYRPSRPEGAEVKGDKKVSKGVARRGEKGPSEAQKRGREPITYTSTYKRAGDLLGDKSSDKAIKELIELNRQFFGDSNLEIAENILSPDGKSNLGSYRSSIIKILNGQVKPKDTFYHESVHKYLDIFTTAEEKLNILNAVKRKYGITDILEAEERLAEDFINYAKNKKGVSGSLARLFEKVISRIRGYFSNKGKIDSFYSDIIAGEAARPSEGMAQYNIFGAAKPIKREAKQQEMNLVFGKDGLFTKIKQYNLTKEELQAARKGSPGVLPGQTNIYDAIKAVSKDKEKFRVDDTWLNKWTELGKELKPMLENKSDNEISRDYLNDYIATRKLDMSSYKDHVRPGNIIVSGSSTLYFRKKLKLAGGKYIGNGNWTLPEDSVLDFAVQLGYTPVNVETKYRSVEPYTYGEGDIITPEQVSIDTNLFQKSRWGEKKGNLLDKYGGETVRIREYLLDSGGFNIDKARKDPMAFGVFTKDISEEEAKKYGGTKAIKAGDIYLISGHNRFSMYMGAKLDDGFMVDHDVEVKKYNNLKDAVHDSIMSNFEEGTAVKTYLHNILKLIRDGHISKSDINSELFGGNAGEKATVLELNDFFDNFDDGVFDAMVTNLGVVKGLKDGEALYKNKISLLGKIANTLNNHPELLGDSYYNQQVLNNIILPILENTSDVSFNRIESNIKKLQNTKTQEEFKEKIQTLFGVEEVPVLKDDIQANADKISKKINTALKNLKKTGVPESSIVFSNLSKALGILGTKPEVATDYLKEEKNIGKPSTVGGLSENIIVFAGEKPKIDVGEKKKEMITAKFGRIREIISKARAEGKLVEKEKKKASLQALKNKNQEAIERLKRKHELDKLKVIIKYRNTPKRVVIELQNYIKKYVPKSQQHRFLKYLTPEKVSFATLNDVTEKIDNFVNKYTKDEILTKIRKLLKTWSEKKQSGRPKSKFGYGADKIADVQSQLNEFINIFGTSGNAKISAEQKEKAVDILYSNQEKYSDTNRRDIDSRAGEGVTTPQEIIIQNRMLDAIIEFDTKSVEELSSLYDYLYNLAVEGKEAGIIAQFNREADKDVYISAINKEVLEGEELVQGELESLGGVAEPNLGAMFHKDDLNWLENMVNEMGERNFKYYSNFISNWIEDIPSLVHRLVNTNIRSSVIARMFNFNREIDKLKNLRRYLNEKTHDAIFDSYFSDVEDIGTMKESKYMNNFKKLSEEVIDMGTLKNEHGHKLRFRMTKAELRKRWMELQDPSLRETIVGEDSPMGYSGEMLRLIESNMDEKDKIFANKQLEIYREMYDFINPVYRILNGTDLPFNDFYSPISRHGVDTSKGDNFVEDFAKEQMMRTYITGGSATKTRKKGAKRYSLATSSDIDVLTKHIKEMTNYIAFGDKIRKIQNFLSTPEARDAIKAKHGSAFLSLLQKHINLVGYSGSRRDTSLMILDRLSANFVEMALAIKVKIGLTQASSFYTFSTEVPAKDFIAGLTDFVKNPKEAYKVLNETTYFRERGSARSMHEMIDRVMQSDVLGNYKKSRTMKNWLLIINEFGDKFAIAAGGWSLYKHSVKPKSEGGLGMTHEEALNHFADIAAGTQQSSDFNRLSLIQREGGTFPRIFLAFQNQLIQYVRRVNIEVREIKQTYKKAIRKGDSKTIAILNRKILRHLKNIFIFWALTAMVYQWMSDMFPNLFTDKKARARVIAAGITGPINAIPVAGPELKSLIGGLITGEDPFDGQVGVLGSISKISDAFTFLRNLVTGKDMTPSQMARGFKDVARTVDLAGVPASSSLGLGTGTMDILSGDIERGAKELLGWSPGTISYLEKISKEGGTKEKSKKKSTSSLDKYKNLGTEKSKSPLDKYKNLGKKKSKGSSLDKYR